MNETTYSPVEVSIKLESELSPRWNKTFTFTVNPITQNLPERREINQWLMDNGGDNVIIKDLREFNLDISIPPDLKYYHNETLLGYVWGVYKGFIMFTPTDELRLKTSKYKPCD